MEEQTRPILALEYVRTESGLMGVQFPKGRWKRPHRERPCLETNHRFPTFVPISHPSAQNLSTFRVCRAFDEARLLVTAQNALPRMSNYPFYLFVYGVISSCQIGESFWQIILWCKSC